jgi:hypothetical protein
VTADQHEPGKLNAAAGALIGAAITGDGSTAQRAAALAQDVPGGYLYFALLVARVSGSKAQAAALVNEWVRDSVRIRARKAM